jgi:hypothetical protein
MAKMNITQLNFWISEIDACERRQKKELVEANLYPAMIKYYEGTQELDNKRKISIINEYFPNTNALISELMYQNPDIIANPTKPQAEADAPLMRSALQYGFDKVDAFTENQLAIFDMVFAGYAAIEVNHIVDKSRDRVDMLSDTQSQIAEEEAKNPGYMEKAFNFIKDKFTGGDSKEKEEEKLEAESPKDEAYSMQEETIVKRWNPLDVLLDWRAERVKDMRYVVKKVRMSKAEFNAKYPLFRDKVSEGSEFEYAQHTTTGDKKTIVLYEIQVKKRGGYITFVISKDFKTSEIDYFERPFKSNGFDLKVQTLHEYGKLYPVSFAKVNKCLQDDINNYVTFMMEVAERNIPKRGYNSSKVNAEGLEALNNNKVNAAVPVDGGSENIWTIPNTNVSAENKELVAIFKQHKEKMWNISESRLSGNAQPQFAEELKIQESGFESRQNLLQQSIRKLIRAELDGLKDIMVTFWDGEYFFKITGGPKPTWYEPQVDPVLGIVTNPLTDILTADYDIDIDISSSLKPNKEKKKKELIEFGTWITGPAVMQFAMSQGYTIDIEVLKKVATEWGWNADNLIKQLPPPPAMGLPALGVPPEGAPVA